LENTPLENKPLQGKTALVTGSNSGIGEAIARRFAREGARVMIHGLDRAEAEAVAASICDGGAEADAHGADLAEVANCEKLIAATAERFGGLDILVNNAAVIARSDLGTTTPEFFDHIIAVNLRAPLFLTQAAVPWFRKAGGGSVINIGSENGYCGEPNQLDYSISKGGLVVLTRNLANTLAREHIRLNVLAVGWVLTPNEYKLQISEGMPEDWPERIPLESAPAGRILTPEEIAFWVSAFASGEAALVNGAVLDLQQFPLTYRNPIKDVKHQQNRPRLV